MVTAPSIYSHEADIVLPDGVLYHFTIDGSTSFSVEGQPTYFSNGSLDISFP
jgi:hypothetical protein